MMTMASAVWDAVGGCAEASAASPAPVSSGVGATVWARKRKNKNRTADIAKRFMIKDLYISSPPDFLALFVR